MGPATCDAPEAGEEGVRGGSAQQPASAVAACSRPACEVRDHGRCRQLVRMHRPAPRCKLSRVGLVVASSRRPSRTAQRRPGDSRVHMRPLRALLSRCGEDAPLTACALSPRRRTLDQLPSFCRLNARWTFAGFTEPTFCGQQCTKCHSTGPIRSKESLQFLLSSDPGFAPLGLRDMRKIDVA